MHRRKTPKASYKKVDVDSGYLSDLVDRSRKSDEAAAKLPVSSCSSGRSRSDIPTDLDFPELIVQWGTFHEHFQRYKLGYHSHGR
jgi:hypothetical protein